MVVVLALPWGLCQKAQPTREKATDLSLEALLELRITEQAVRELGLDDQPKTGNHFHLSAFQLPVSIDIIEHDTARARGLKSVTEAAENLVGVLSGESPAEPSSFSIRGFTRDGIAILRDGIRAGPSTMTMRPQNTFNLDRVEIYKGPGSLHHGPGTAGGAINMVTRRARLDLPRRTELFGSWGRYESFDAGFGMGTPLGHRTALRVDANVTQSQGWVDRTDSDSLNLTTSLVWAVNHRLLVEVSLDLLDDDLPAYWGTPLIDAAAARAPLTGVVETRDGRVLDDRLRFTNYNIGDQLSQSEHLWTRLGVDWQVSDKIAIKQSAYHFSADRAWRNAESYLFDSDLETLARDRFFVFHDQSLSGYQLDAVLTDLFEGFEQEWVVGLDYTRHDFLRMRGFPDGDRVALDQPEPGQFGPEVAFSSPTDIRTLAGILDFTARLSSQWRIFAGFRAEHTDLDRKNLDPAGVLVAEESFARDFQPLSYRLGLTYQIDSGKLVYLSHGTGHDPVGSNIFQVNAAENFDLTDIVQTEIGFKWLDQEDRFQLTAAVFDSERKNSLLLASHNNAFDNIGDQRARGLELAGLVRMGENTRFGGNVAYTDADYGNFIDPDFGHDVGGNQPHNVPDWVAGAWLSRGGLLGLPLDVGFGVRHVGDRFADSANTVLLKQYTLTNAFLAYQTRQFRLALNVRNLGNIDYVPWGDIFYPNQLALAAPRNYELSVHVKF
nr:TonB-dependent receptor [Acanthopleuribacter pedis]